MKLKNTHILVLIIIVATILRTYDFFNIPYSHDEFSALFRLEFDNFRDLIAQGVRVDGHPAGIHVFLYYWTMLFGKAEWVVKLPFILFGIASVWLIFKIGKQWKNETVGLIAAAFMSVSQFMVMYSQIARPYISGLFFSLLMFYFWSRIILYPNKRFFTNSIGFVLGASLCTYNHHFSMLFAVIVGVIGLFMINKKFILRYVLAGIIVFILYVPHLEILFYQMKTGGVEGWLAKPQNDFLWQFIRYMFNYSWLFLALAIILIFYGWKNEKIYMSRKYFLLFVGLFLFPFLIGFFYSKYVNSVLQFSVLIFSAPFLYFIIFSHLKKLTFYKNLIIILSVLSVGTLSLVFHRHHYSMFYDCHFEHSITDLDSANDKHDQVPAVFDVRKDIVLYYANRHEIDTVFRWFDSFKSKQVLQQFLLDASKSKKHFYLAANSANDPYVVPLIQKYYPHVIWQKNYFIGTNYLFSKNLETSENKNRSLITHLNIENELDKRWQEFPKGSFSKDGIEINEEMEWCPSFQDNVSSLVEHKNDFIDIVLTYSSSEEIDEAVLVAEIINNDESIHWKGVSFSEFLSDSSSTANVYESLKLSDIPEAMEGKVKIYIWNKGQENFTIEQLKIYARKGNPIIYGLFNPI
ncbi:MAG: glycosyltransferase family 39 protein [Brumimicrobium sp.]